jgi:hypothetical protein
MLLTGIMIGFIFGMLFKELILNFVIRKIENFILDNKYKKDFHYQFRGFPCTDRNWNIGGQYEDETGRGGGVLEWCDSKEDAENLLKIMKQDKRFSHLKIYNR